jgi:hypothetical protein
MPQTTSAEAFLSRPAVQPTSRSVGCEHAKAGVEHPVKLGTSVRRGRSAETLTLRYSFRPGSCDIKKPGKLKLRDEVAELRVGDTAFHGKATAPKVSEFVLIHDKHGWRLERLGRSIKNLNPANR